MSTEDIAELRTQADALDVGEEALALYTRILDLDPDDQAAANMVGRSLQELGRTEEATEHWRFIVELQPGNAIARNRLASMKPTKEPVQVTTSRPTKPQRAPSDVVEPTLAGPGRDGALRLLAQSISMIEKIDPSRLSVTERAGQARFRVYAGPEPAVTPSRGALAVLVYAPAITPELEAAIAGLETAPAAMLPDSLEIRVPYEQADALAELLAGPHREHLRRSVAEGPPPWGHSHSAKLRDYVVKQAAAAAPAQRP